MKDSLTRRRFLSTAGAAAGSLILPVRANEFPALKEEQTVIAFGHIGPISDEGWTYSHHLGLLAVREAFPRARYIEVESLPYSSDATRTFRQFVAQRANIVILSSEFGDLLHDVSNKAPQIAWLECNGHSIAPNLGAYYIRHWLPSYVNGVAAGLMSKTGKFGYVGSMPVPSVYSGVNAFLMGARTVNPTSTMQVILINSWFDPQAASQAGTALIDNGCDVLFGIMDEAAYLQVAEKRGVHAVMWNMDERRFGPKAYIGAVVLDWRKYYVKQVTDRINGTWQPEMTMLGMGEGADRDQWGDSVPEAVRRQADAVRDKILKGWSPMVGELKDSKGKIRVAKGDVMDDVALYNCTWAIEGVSGLG